MKITVVGAGAMGGSYGGLLAVAGHEVGLIDAWQAHVDAINRDGLRVEGVLGDHRVRLPASTTASTDAAADVVIVFVDANNTEKAAATARRLLGPEGFAITFQNGIGNVEKLQAALGRERVLGGSSMCSAATRGPGHVCLTHLGATSVGETDGSESPRALQLLEALRGAGFEAEIEPNIMDLIWQKFVVNCGVNAIADTELPSSVVAVDIGAGRKAIAIAAGNAHTCVLLDTGQVRCWGAGANGRLGYGNVNDVGDNESPATAGPVDLGAGRRRSPSRPATPTPARCSTPGRCAAGASGDDGRLGYGNTNSIGDNETPGDRRGGRHRRGPQRDCDHRR